MLEEAELDRRFSFDDKRLTLETLQIRVWVDRPHVSIEGIIPIAEGDIVSAAS